MTTRKFFAIAAVIGLIATMMGSSMISPARANGDPTRTPRPSPTVTTTFTPTSTHTPSPTLTPSPSPTPACAPAIDIAVVPNPAMIGELVMVTVTNTSQGGSGPIHGVRVTFNPGGSEWWDVGTLQQGESVTRTNTFQNTGTYLFVAFAPTSCSGSVEDRAVLTVAGQPTPSPTPKPTPPGIVPQVWLPIMVRNHPPCQPLNGSLQVSPYPEFQVVAWRMNQCAQAPLQVLLLGDPRAYLTNPIPANLSWYVTERSGYWDSVSPIHAIQVQARNLGVYETIRVQLIVSGLQDGEEWFAETTLRFTGAFPTSTPGPSPTPNTPHPTPTPVPCPPNCPESTPTPAPPPSVTPTPTNTLVAP